LSSHSEGFAGSGERFIVVATVPFGASGGANNLRIAAVHPTLRDAPPPEGQHFPT
jgi:hypothetical protein